MKNIGILGMGAYLPSSIRTNDWWPTDIVQKWLADKNRVINSASVMTNNWDQLPLEQRCLMAALMEFKNDPFDGSQKRHIMAADEKTSDMEIQAAKAALTNSGIQPNDIDFLLCQSTLPDTLSDPNSCTIHHQLNLKRSCYSQDMSGMCNAFLSQLYLAQSLICSGSAKYGLLIQSSGMSRLQDQENPMSPLFGDGATAVVVGAVGSNEGVISMINYTNGNLGQYLCNGIAGKNWYDEGKIKTFFANPTHGLRMISDAIKQSQTLLEQNLIEAKLDKAQINFYAGHQGVKWFRAATQKAMGLEHAATYDTFPVYASLVGANVPLVLYFAKENKLINKNDYIASFTPGTGVTATSTILRWVI